MFFDGLACSQQASQADGRIRAWWVAGTIKSASVKPMAGTRRAARVRTAVAT
jgi:hypothetical protein